MNSTDKKSAIVAELIGLLQNTQNFQELFESLMERIASLLGAERCTLFLLDPEDNRLHSYVATGGDIEEITLDLGVGVVGQCIANNHSVIVEDAYKDERFFQGVDDVSGLITKTILCVPIRDQRQQAIGAIEVMNKLVGSFVQEDADAMESVAPLIASTLESAKLYQSVIRKNIELIKTRRKLLLKMEELKTVLDIEQEANTTQDVDSLLRLAMHQILRLLKCDAVTVALRSDERNDLQCYSISTDDHNDLKHYFTEEESGFVGYALRFAKVRVSNSPPEESQQYSEFSRRFKFPIGAILCVPIAKGEGGIGAIEIVMGKEKTRKFTAEDEMTLRVLAAQLGRLIELKREYAAKKRAEHLTALGQMLSGIIHDFRTPMTILSGLFYLTVTEQDEAERERNYAEAQRQIRLINGMMEDTLGFARGKSTISIKNVSLRPFVADLEAQVLKTYETQEGIFSFTVAGLDEAPFDEDKIRRVVINMIRNALESLTGADGKVHFAAENLQDELIFRIADTGKGIPEDIRDRVFDSFVTSGKKGGTGLGLAIAKDIIAQHHGKIRFETETGKGTTFIISLPKHPHP